MENWQDPRPLFPWSAPPENQGVRNAPKLKPNIYARMARFSVQHPVAILLLLIFAATVAATVLLLTLRVDLTQVKPVEARSADQRADTEFGIRFGHVESVLRIRLSSSFPDVLAPVARRISTELKARTELIATVLVPELEATKPQFAPYYVDTPELNRRIESVRAAQAYLQLLAASPTLGGLNGVLATAKGAAEAGSPPAILAPLLDSLATASNSLVEGKAASVDWSSATDFSSAPQLPEIVLLVLPANPGDASLIAQVQRDVDGILAENKAVTAQVELAGKRQFAGAAPSTGRQFIVALFLAALFLVSLFTVYLRSPRDVVLALLPCGAAVLAGMAVTAFMQSPLDPAATTLALLLVPGSVTMALCYVLALSRHEKRAISTMSLIMLAAQQSGAAVIALMAIAIVLWLVWLSLVAAVSPALAIGAVAGHLVAAVATLLVVPTFAALVPRSKPEFVPAAVAPSGQGWSLMQRWLLLRPWAALVLLAAAIISAILIVVDPGSTGSNPASQPFQLQAESYQAASARIAALRAEEAVGRVVWIDDFLPSDTEAKRAALSLLSGISLPQPATIGTPSNLLAGQYAQLDEALLLLANASEQSKPMQLAALRLRRSLAVLASDAGGAAQAGRRFEQMMAGSVQALPAYLSGLSSLAPPTASDLDPALRMLFLAEDGTYRIEVWPRPPVSESEFTNAVRSIDAHALYANPNAENLSPAARWRFAMALLVACCGILGVAMIAFGRLAAAVEFALAQACTLLLFGGIAEVAELFQPELVEVAVFTGLSTSAMAGLWRQLAGRNPWMVPWSYLLGPLAAVAVALPLVLLSIEELAGFSRSLLLYAAVAVVAQTVLVPQLSTWLSALPQARPRSLWPRAEKRNPPGDSRLSTNNASGATTLSNAEPQQKPRSGV
jgi:hypothetical protein